MMFTISLFKFEEVSSGHFSYYILTFAGICAGTAVANF